MYVCILENKPINSVISDEKGLVKGLGKSLGGV